MTDHSDFFPDENSDEEYPSPNTYSSEDGSPEFTGNLDTDPVFLGSVDLDQFGDLFANVYSENADFDTNTIDLFELRDLIGDVDDAESRVHFELEDLPEDFDPDEPNVRGPFPDERALADWLEETGLFGLADWYYDSENDEYWIELGDST